jgi:N-acyl-D-aspartate/D-glutamate deacylase
VLDLLVKSALVIDGTGAPPFSADIGVSGDEIVEIGSLSRAATRQVIDASGLTAAPGFIDIHSHADLTLPSYPAAQNSIRQGVTTEVTGMCGFSPAPVVSNRRSDMQQFVRGFGPDLSWEWTSFEEYLVALERAQPPVNVVPAVGHGALRLASMGYAARPANEHELEHQSALLVECLDQGAWGMSSGLVYPPGCYAPTAELVHLARVLAERGRAYFTHIRGELDTVRQALDEALAIAEATGALVQIAHLKAAGRMNWGSMPALLNTIEQARARGVAAHADVYPYTAGSTYLSNLLPPWVQEGGKANMVERLRDPTCRERIRDDMEHGLPGWSNQLKGAGGWEQVLLNSTALAENSRWQGLSVAEAAQQAGKDPLAFTLDLLAEEEGATTMIVFMMDEADVRHALEAPFTMVGSDALGITGPAVRTHPRAFGCFARVLGRYTRDAGLLRLEEAVHKMTGLPARVLGLPDRGVLRAGRKADMVIFDPARVLDRATYEHPTLPPEGIAFVLVNGHVAVERGRSSERRAGRVLRRH